MDFDRTSLDWVDHDYASFQYGFEGESMVLTKIWTNEAGGGLQSTNIMSPNQGQGIRFEQQTLANRDEWKRWFQYVSYLNSRSGESTRGICMVLCGRVDPVFDDMQSPINYLPFDQSIFVQLVELFRIHPRITRTIGRDPCYFSIQNHDRDWRDERVDDLTGGERMITCTTRSSAQLPDDIAMSSAFLLETGLSLAVIYGCTPKQRIDATRRIETCDISSTNHPLLLPGMFFEMERVRLGDAVDKLLDNFALRGSSSDRDLDLDMDKPRMTDFLKSCYDSRELINHIEAAQQQLGKLISAANSSDNMIIPLQTRLLDISHELTTKTSDCALVNTNTSLTMQTVMNHFARLDNQTNLRLSKVNTNLARTNTGLSQDMKRDSSQMRSIALLTMVFLPMSTVAGVFSTGFFSWDADGTKGESVVSRYLWVLIVVGGGLTAVVVGVWWWATSWRGARRGTGTGTGRRRRRKVGGKGKGKGFLGRMGWRRKGRRGKAVEGTGEERRDVGEVDLERGDDDAISMDLGRDDIEPVDGERERVGGGVEFKLERYP